MQQYRFSKLIHSIFVILFFTTAYAHGSNSVETQPNFLVYSPTAGQIINGGTNVNVIWTNANGVTTNYTIEYSSNLGQTYTFIANYTASIVAATYSWSTPSINSTQCIVRVRKTNDASTSGISPMFTITTPPPSLTLSNPLGNNTYTAGASINIIWSYTTLNNIDIHFSADGGLSWSLVATSVAANLSYYTWQLPIIATSAGKVRIRNSQDSTISSQNATNFYIIIPSITVNVPNGGQNWQAQTNRTIYWSSTTLSGTNVNVEYSIDSGATWQGIAYGIYNIGSKTWYVPNTPSNKCFIKVSDANNLLTFDISNAPFTITPLLGTITLYSFVNSQFAAVGDTIPIIYSTTNINNVDIEYSYDGGITWNMIASNVIANGFYNWVIPNTISQQCFIRIKNSLNASVLAQNLNAFTIFIPSLTLITPNGGETLQGGSTFTVSWSGIPTQYYINLQYQTSNNGPWINFSQAPSSGFNAINTYNWTVPNINSNNCRFRIVDNSDTSISDISNSTFTINYVQENVYLLLPYGGQSYAINTTIQIQWSVVNIDTLELFFSVDNGLSWTNIASNLTSYPTVNSIYSSGYYDWFTPNTLSNQCILRLVDKYNYNNFSQNTPTFSLVNPFIEILSPNGFEQIPGGNPVNIQFNNSGTGNLNILFSSNGGTIWDTIASNYYQGTNGLFPNSINWIAPYINSDSCLIKIESVTGQIIDYTNNYFSIISTITKLNTNHDKKEIKFYPNPAKDFITITSEKNDIIEIKLVNILGDEVYSKEYNTSTPLFINLNYLINGIYFIKTLNSFGKNNYYKFIIEK